MLLAVWRKKPCFIQFSLKNIALNFWGVFLAHPVVAKPKALVVTGDGIPNV